MGSPSTKMVVMNPRSLDITNSLKKPQKCVGDLEFAFKFMKRVSKYIHNQREKVGINFVEGIKHHALFSRDSSCKFWHILGVSILYYT